MKTSDIFKTTYSLVRKASRTRGSVRDEYRTTLPGSDWPVAFSKTSPESQENLIVLLREHVKNALTRRYYFTSSGKTVFALYHLPGGWCYDITDPSRSGPCTISLSPSVSLAEADEIVRRHAACHEG